MVIIIQTFVRHTMPAILTKSEVTLCLGFKGIMLSNPRQSVTSDLVGIAGALM